MVYRHVLFPSTAVGTRIVPEHVSVFFSTGTNAKQPTQETLYIVDLPEVLLLVAFASHQVRIAKDPDSVK